MKRIYNLAVALLVSSVVYGQHVYDPATQAQANPFPTFEIDAKAQKAWKAKLEESKERASGKASLDKVRVSHSEERRNEYVAGASGFVAPLLPDSIARQHFSATGITNVNTHAVGAIFHPISFDFVKNDLGVSDRDSFTVDSVHVLGIYRVVNPGVRDTLRMRFFTSDSSENSPAFGQLFLVQTSPFPGARVRSIRYSSNGNQGSQARPNAPGIVMQDRIMQVTDTNITEFTIGIPGGMKCNPGSLFGVFIEFIPGSPWTGADMYYDPVDRLETMNSLAIAGAQEDANADDFYAFDPTSYGATHTLFTNPRYGVGDPAFTNDQIGPSASSNLSIAFTYSAGEVSVGREELNPSNVVIADNYPNPFNAQTTIEYALKANSAVQFEVTDITGKVVMESNEGFKTQGNYKIQLNADDFNNGIYYYSIITETGRVTKKMIVVE